MNDFELLSLKYPAMRKTIEINKNNGYTADEIDGKFQEAFEVNLYNGYTQQEIHSKFGITEQSNKLWQKEQEAEARRNMAKAYEVTEEDFGKIEKLSYITGRPNQLYLNDKSYYEKAAKQLEAIEAMKALKPQKQSLQTTMQSYGAAKFNQFANEPLTMQDNIAYAPMRTLHSAQKIIYGMAQAADATGAWIVDKVAPDSSVAKDLDAWAEYFAHPEETELGAWVAGKQYKRQQLAEANSGLLGRIAVDLGDIILDTEFLMATMGAATAISSAKGAEMLLTQISPVLKNIKVAAKMHGTMAFLTTNGDLEDRAKAAAYRVAYSLTDYISTGFGYGAKAVGLDLAQNFLLGSETYMQAYQEAEDPSEFLKLAIPQLATDVFFALKVRGAPESDMIAYKDKMIKERMKTFNIPEDQAKDQVNEFWKLHDESMERVAGASLKGEDVDASALMYDPLTRKGYQIIDVRDNFVIAVDPKNVEDTKLFRKDYLRPQELATRESRAVNFYKDKDIKDIHVYLRDGKGRVAHPANNKKILAETLNDTSLSIEERTEIRDMIDHPNAPFTLEEVKNLPIAEAAGRLGFKGVTIALPDNSDIPIGKLLRKKAPESEEINKLVDGIKATIDAEDIDAASIDKILWKLSDINFSGSPREGDASLQHKDLLIEGLKNNPELAHYIHGDLDSFVNKRVLANVSLAELKQISTEIDVIAKKGRMDYEMKNAAKVEMVDTLGSEVKGLLDDAPVKKWIGAELKRSYNTPDRNFDILDGNQNFKGRFVDLFWRKTNRNVDSQLTHTRMRREKVRIIDVRELARKQDIGDGVMLSTSQLMGIYAHSKVPHQLKGMMDLNGLTREQIDWAIGRLTTEQKDMADDMLRDWETNFDRINNAVREYSNTGMKFVPFYSTIYFTDAEGGRVSLHRDNAGIIQNMVDMNKSTERLTVAMKKAYAKHGFSHTRVEEYGPEMEGLRLDLDLFAVWNRSLDAQEHFAAHANHVKLMRSVLDYSDLKGVKNRDILREKYGQQFEREIDGYINRIADPSFYKADYHVSKVMSWLRELRHNSAICYIGYNYLSSVKQVGALGLYLRDAGPTDLIASIGRAMVPGEYTKMKQQAEELDPQMRHRGIEQVVVEMEAEASGSTKFRDRVASNSMMGIRITDKWATVIGWNAVFETNMRKTRGDMTASAIAAQESTLQTQQATHPKDLPAAYATDNEFVNLFLLFTNQTNKIWNMSTHDIWSEAKNGDLSQALKNVLGITASAMIIYGIESANDNSDEADSFPEFVMKASLNQAASGIPFIGSDIVSHFKGYGTEGFAVSESIAKALRVGGKLAKGEEITDNMFWDTCTSLSVLYFGTPVYGPKKLLQLVEGE